MYKDYWRASRLCGSGKWRNFTFTVRHSGLTAGTENPIESMCTVEFRYVTLCHCQNSADLPFECCESVGGSESVGDCE